MVIIRDGHRVVGVISMPWESSGGGGGGLWRSGEAVVVLNGAVRRRLRPRHRIPVPEVLYPGVVGVCVVVLYVRIRGPSTAALLVSGPLGLELRMR